MFLLKSGPAGSSIAALVGALEVVLGLLLGHLGYALLTKHGEQVRGYQTRLAYLAIVLGMLTVYEMLRLFSPAPVASAG
jgi:predicted permease